MEVSSLQKKGSGVEKTGCGKGSRWQLIVEGRRGLPLAITAQSARPGEILFVEKTLASIPLNKYPKRMIGDKLYYCQPLRKRLLDNHRCELIAPIRKRYRHCTQDGRKLRRMRRRWKVERTNSWLKKYRRITIRYEVKLQNFSAFLILACLHLYLRYF